MRSSGRVGGSEAGLGAPRASSGWTQSGWLEKKEGNDWKRLWCTVDGDQVHCFETEASMGGKTAHTRLASDLLSFCPRFTAHSRPLNVSGPRPSASARSTMGILAALGRDLRCVGWRWGRYSGWVHEPRRSHRRP